MSHYKSNLDDVRFNLFEVFGRADVLGTGPWDDLDRATVEEMLSAGSELAETELAKSFNDLDLGEIEFDARTGTARLPEGLRASIARSSEPSRRASRPITTDRTSATAPATTA